MINSARRNQIDESQTRLHPLPVPAGAEHDAHGHGRSRRSNAGLDDYRAFVRELKPGRRLLYLGDNCGKIVFDRVLVEHLVALGLTVTFVVKSGPVINDATLRDARDTGMTRVCRVITTGSNDIGVHWARASAEFRRHAYAADVILAKGHGNFETCVGRPGNYYFLLKAKCDMVAQELGVKLGDTVFRKAGTLTSYALVQGGFNAGSYTPHGPSIRIPKQYRNRAVRLQTAVRL
jgi:hypothetical protein